MASKFCPRGAATAASRMFGSHTFVGQTSLLFPLDQSACFTALQITTTDQESVGCGLQ